MNLALSEEQTLLQDSVRAFLDAEYGFRQRQASLEAPAACLPGLWQQFAAMGWLGLRVPEAGGGSGAGLFEAGLLLRAFGRHLVVEPFAASALLATPMLVALGTAEQQSAWLPALVDGRARAALAHADGASPASAPDLPPRSLRALRTGHGWRLDGTQPLVAGAAGADLLLVSARLGDDGGHRVFLLAPDTPGLQLRPARTADGAWAADLQLDAVQLDPDRLLGPEQDASDALQRCLAHHRIGACWEASGTMAALLEQTASHVRQRVQFGQPLAQFQVVQHRLAEMAVACEEALAACELAALRIEEDGGATDATLLASMAKAKVGREARYLAQNAVQLHGAMGVTEELAVAAGFRKLNLFLQQGGSTAAHCHALGERLLQQQGWRQSRTLGPAEDRA